MSSSIRVPIPRPGTDLLRYFVDLASEDAFGPALDRSVVEFDERARLTGTEVTGVFPTDDGVAVAYEVSWEAFHPCDDKTVTGKHARVLRGARNASEWNFEKAAVQESRSTGGEF